MNGAYFKFLFTTIIKKKPVWITSIIFLFVVSCFLIIIPAIAKINTLQLWANTTMIVSQSLIGIVGALVTAVLAINIFQDGKDEGTDLVMSSKPMIRKHVVFSKFLVFGLILLIVNLASVLISIFTIFLPRTEIKYYWGLLLSLFIGNTISFAVFGSLASLIATKVNKTGVIVINLLIPLVFLIYQLLGLFVIPSPTKTAITNGSPISSYTIVKRNEETGTYEEQNFAGFEFVSGFQNFTKYEISNWKDVQNYWTDVCNSTPTGWLNATEISSQIGSTYLSIDIDKYSDRYSQRIFGSSSRFYDYVLTSPISPEITSGVENKQSVDFLYDLLNDDNSPHAFETPTGERIYQASKIYLPAIKFHSSSALRGFTDFIPIGQIKSKEFNSSNDVFFEPEQWLKYKKSFDIMYQNVFRYDLKDLNNNSYYSFAGITSPVKYYQIPFVTNDNIKRVFDLIWACFTNRVDKYISKDSWTFVPENLEITSVKDLNQRLLQFKNYVLWKATQDQKNYVANGYVSKKYSTYELAAKNQTKSQLSFYDSCNIEHLDNTWFMAYKDKKTNFDYLEPNTQTVSSQWLNDCWEKEKELISDLSSQEQIEAATSCAKYKIEQCGFIASKFAKVDEKYMYSSLDNSVRTTDNYGEIFSTTFEWIPYFESQLLKYLAPAGHNFQYFFYTTTRKYNFWMFAIIWSSISVCLFTGAIIIYNKNDIK